jgi:hypothetical protein
MQSFYDRLSDPQESTSHQTYLIEQMKLYIDSAKPFNIANVQIKFGLGYNRAISLINYFVREGSIIKNIAGQYVKIQQGLTFNNLKGIN